MPATAKARLGGAATPLVASESRVSLRLVDTLRAHLQVPTLSLLLDSNRSGLEKNALLFRRDAGLEFVGDAALDLATIEAIAEQKPKASARELVWLRRKLASHQTLAHITERLHFDPADLLSRDGHRAALADTLESVLGLIYLSTDFDAFRAVVRDCLASAWPRSSTWGHPPGNFLDAMASEPGLPAKDSRLLWGSTVLKLLVSERLVRETPRANLGTLSRRREQVLHVNALAKVTERNHVIGWRHLVRRPIPEDPKAKVRWQATLVKVATGATYTEKGFAGAKRWVNRWIA